ncbi:MAG: hypothetical protein C5S49_06460 [Candidatus Methanogaster sp.]|nr:MAG: hypothetical protein C5S49_06460 [ANME-2 cluster archaeon]
MLKFCFAGNVFSHTGRFVGFGMWKNRSEMVNSSKRVGGTRKRFDEGMKR